MQTKPRATKSFDDLTERQQAACYAFSKKYRQELDDVAAHLDTFFKLANSEMTIMQAETETNLTIIDQTHPTLF